MNLLKPALQSGTLRCVGSTTYKEYRQHFEKDRALVRRFQPGEYNTYASVAENILYGEPTDERLDREHLPNDPYVREVLEACGLTQRFREVSLGLIDTQAVNYIQRIA